MKSIGQELNWHVLRVTLVLRIILKGMIEGIYILSQLNELCVLAIAQFKVIKNILVGLQVSLV